MVSSAVEKVSVIPVSDSCQAWISVALQEVATIKSGTTPARNLYDRFYRNGTINWVKTLDLNNGHITSTEEKITAAALSETCLRVLKPGTVLVAMYGGFNQIGRTGLLKISATVNQALSAIQPDCKLLNSEYLLQNLNYRVNYWKQIASSSRKDPNITGQDVKKYQLPIPRIDEQERIATALRNTDALISSLEQLIEKKRNIKQGAMQELLTGKKRLPGFSGDAEVKAISEIARIQRGASPRPIDSPVWFDENSLIGWVRISDVTSSGIFLRKTTQRLSLAGVRQSRPVAHGSLIMSICATVGRPIITEIDVCIHDGFVVFENLQVDQRYLFYMLKFIEPDWSKHGQTGSQMNLNTGLINRTCIRIVSLEEQKAIASMLTDLDADLTALDERLSKVRELKQGMMQVLLTGKIRLI
jgi:type I restriction enzyme S subunit